mgnify:FL=1
MNYRIIVSGLLVLFSVVWASNLNELVDYVVNPGPPGQLLYNVSKYFGFLGICVLLLQVIIGLASKFLKKSGGWHKKNAYLLLVLVFLHVLTFVSAVSVRSGSFAWEVVVPDMSNYYHTMISFGILSSVVVVVSMFTGKELVKRKAEHVAKMHIGLACLSMLALVHALSIGSETRSDMSIILFSVLILMMLLQAAFLMLRLVISIRVGVQIED